MNHVLSPIDSLLGGSDGTSAWATLLRDEGRLIGQAPPRRRRRRREKRTRGGYAAHAPYVHRLGCAAHDPDATACRRQPSAEDARVGVEGRLPAEVGVEDGGVARDVARGHEV